MRKELGSLYYNIIVFAIFPSNCDDVHKQKNSSGKHCCCFFSACVREMARRLDEVEKNLRQSPTLSVERDLRRQIGDFRESEIQLKQQVDNLTARNQGLLEQLENAKYQLKLKSKELSDVKETMESLVQDFTAKETKMKVQLDESTERERLLKIKLDQAAVREKLLRQEIRQAVQDECQLTVGSLTTDAMLTPALSRPTGACICTLWGKNCTT